MNTGAIAARSVREAAASLKRPYRVVWPMVALILLVPGYLVISQLAAGQAAHVPALALDERIPLQPEWVLVYGPLYLFLILLPLFVIRTDRHLRRTFYAYLAVWITAFAGFVLYPTIAPRPGDSIEAEGFAAWGLNFLYSADTPYNCFPSLHVAHSFVSAFSVSRVHGTLGAGAIACALLVAVSTLFTKQHYVLDVVAGILMAAAACGVFLYGVRRSDIPESDRRAAPALAFVVAAIVGLLFSAYAVLYTIGVEI